VMQVQRVLVFCKLFFLVLRNFCVDKPVNTHQTGTLAPWPYVFTIEQNLTT